METLTTWGVAAQASTVAHVKHHVVFLQNSLIKFINVPAQVLALYFLWVSLSASGAAGLDPRALLTYNLLAFSIRWLFNFRGVAQEYEKAIYEGGLVNSVVRPLPLSAVEFGRTLARVFVNGAALLVVIVPLALAGLVHVRGPDLAAFALLLLLGAWVQFLVYALLGLLAFWMEKIFGVIYAFELTLLLSAGTLLPLTVYPPGVAGALLHLPFRFFAYTPIHALQGAASWTWVAGEALSALLWIAVLSVAHGALWRAGMRRFSGMGV